MLPDSKTSTPAALAIVGQIQGILERLSARKNGCPCIFHENGSPINPRRLTEALKSACRQAGVPIRTPHALRRTAAMDGLAAGLDPSTVMQLTHHKDVNVFFRHYGQTTLARITAGQLALERFRARCHRESSRRKEA